MRYIRKPEQIEAFVFTADVEVLAPKWFCTAVDQETIFIDRNLVDGAAHVYGCSIKNNTGWLRAKLGDYIIRDSHGKIYPCKKSEFGAKYKKCDEDRRKVE